MNEENKKKISTGKILGIVLIAVIAVLAVLLIMTNINLTEANHTIAAQASEMEGLKADLGTLTSENEQLKSKTDDLNQQIAALTDENANLKAVLEENHISLSVDGSAIENITAAQYADLMQEAGLPIENIVEYTEETDVNGLLGRPGEYTGKVNFADSRLEQFDAADPTGGSIEVFESEEDMLRRKDYIESIQREMPLLGSQYLYPSPDGLALLRVEYDVTPEQAEQYRIAFEEICANGSATPVS